MDAVRPPDPEEQADPSVYICPLHAGDGQELFHHLGKGVLFVM
jgi:hypothetical protein